MGEAVMRTISAGGEMSRKLIDVIRRLVAEAAELGELESYQYLGARGQLVTGKRFPPRWFDRLDKAIETGAFDSLSIDRIIDIMLRGPR
jgi:hypothetical protein